MEKMENERIHMFCSEYLEPLYYFCLKKTGDPGEAEELAADISLQVLLSLQKTAPDNLSAWIWRIARNRYSHWAAEAVARRNRTAPLTEELSDPLSLEETAEDALLAGDRLRLLRRELAFIAREYREILVAYYIDRQSVRQIAEALGQPKGTVTSRLFRSRNILKEGMSMAREFGARSYRPESVHFGASGNQPSGLPWRAVERQLPKNILLHADNNPCTLEELAIELGIALPYMEEEVGLLEEGELLKKTGGAGAARYVTNFFIADTDCQQAVYAAQKRDSALRARLAYELAEGALPGIRKLGVIPASMDDGGFLWVLLPRLMDTVLNSVGANGVWDMFKRRDGGTWGFMGCEEGAGIPENRGTGHDGVGSNIDRDTCCSYYSFNAVESLSGMRGGRMGANQAILLGDIFRNNRKYSSLTEPERGLFKGLEGRYVHTEGNRIVPDIAVFNTKTYDKMFALLKQQPGYCELRNLTGALFNEVRELLKTRSNPILHEYMDYYTSMMMCDIRGMLINEELAAGRLRVPEELETGRAGIYLRC
ncbi:MAG: sigma-70 family RNA polymerase sigma factor [Oscillospiraceae bacterium]|nr:sigma-70 family RNA polymerase sigma factor [Oscillospiraceae bacterium]